MGFKSSISRIPGRLKSHVLDLGPPGNVIVMSGMGRSGTTWAGNIVNYDNTHRVMFEPFFPQRVDEARDFKPLQYLRAGCSEPRLREQARKVLAGQVRSAWVDREIRGCFYLRRIIKAIRCNLMLDWLQDIADNPPIVLVIRHPLQVARSWTRLRWRTGQLDVLMSQSQLLHDFPVVGQAVKRIDPEDQVHRILFTWCVLHLVPLSILTSSDAHVVFYERLVVAPSDAIADLFGYLGRGFDEEAALRAWEESSSTNWLSTDFKQDRSDVLNGWKREFPRKHVAKMGELLNVFGLENLYDTDGMPTGCGVLEDTARVPAE